MHSQASVSERLQRMGYASENRMRLYGEELHLVSNPVADDTGYSVLAVVVRSGNLKHVRIPLTVVNMLERELQRESAAELTVELAA